MEINGQKSVKKRPTKLRNTEKRAFPPSKPSDIMSQTPSKDSSYEDLYQLCLDWIPNLPKIPEL